MKKLLVAAALLLLLGALAAAYLWRQATALPDWYEDASVSVPPDSEGDGSPEVAEFVPTPEASGAAAEVTPPAGDPPPPPGASSPKPRTKRKEVRNFHTRGLPAGTQTPIKASRAVLENGELEAGVVLDLSRIPRDGLVPRDRELYDRAVQSFPALARRDVYVGIEDRPQIQDGAVKLGSNPKIRVGNLRYSLERAAANLGMSEQELRREFDRELGRLGLAADARQK